MSLRARLAILAVALVAIGLAVAGFATHRFLSDFLVDRVDAQLESARPFALGAVLEPDLRPGPGSGPGPFTLPYGTYAAVFDDEGEELGSVSVPEQTNVSPPDLSGALPTDERAIHFTANAEDGSLTYRALVTSIDAVPGTDQGVTLVVAIPLSDVAATLRQLVIVELLVGIAVLVLVGALALWLVRIGLRPLEGIGETAGAIAAGDLTQRVEPADERTEVGRLGLSLNAMLVQIEAAFEERRASEARLRRFVADASHELRTPLTSIRGYAELFRRGAGSRPEDLEKSMKRIEAEASRMGVLVDDLLLLARLDQGRPLGRESVDLDGVLVEGTEAAQAIEPDRPIDLVVEGEYQGAW